MFSTKGLAFFLESDKESKDEGVHIDLQSIDVIYNPEYDKIVQSYKIPIFFKSQLEDESLQTHVRQGFLDNGRHKVPLVF